MAVVQRPLNSPGDPQTKSSVPPEPSTGVAPDDWSKLDQKDQRARFLQKAQEASEAKAETVRAQKVAEDAQRRISELERETQYLTRLMTTPAAGQVNPAYTQPYGQVPPTSPVPIAGTPQVEEFDPWDSEKATDYIKGKIAQAQNEMLQFYNTDQGQRDKQRQWEFGLSTHWSGQLAQLLTRDPQTNVQQLFDRARQTGVWDLERVYTDVYGDKLREAERTRIREEERAKVETEYQARAAALSPNGGTTSGSPFPPPVMGAPGAIPRARPVETVPKNYGQATREAYKDFAGKIVTAEGGG